jgi:hypothetical protein
LDFDNKVLVDTVHTGFNIRGLDYDPIENVIWISGNWEPEFYKIDLQGNIIDHWIASGITMNNISGLAYDDITEGGPSLWGFCQDSTGVMIVKYNIASQSQTGNMIDMSGICKNGTGFAGGLFIESLGSPRSGYTLGGMVQNDIAFAFELSYADHLVNTGEQYAFDEVKIFPNPTVDLLNISLPASDDQLSYKVISITGQIIKTGTLENGNNTIDVTDLNSGSYIVQIHNKGKFSFSKKILKQ